MTYLTDTIVVGLTMDKVLEARSKYYVPFGIFRVRGVRDTYAASYPLNIIEALATSTILKRVTNRTTRNTRSVVVVLLRIDNAF
jgi:hypothetical protein